MTLFDQAGAIFSPCEKYRYRLWRDLGSGDGTLAFLALNPSRATAEISDPTCTRCTIRASMMGFRRFEMLNLFAWRSTDPKGLLTCPQDPVGPENDATILDCAKEAKMLVCAWGSASPLIPKRAEHVVEMLKGAGVKLHALKVSERTSQPLHPLYLGYHLQPQEWRP